MTPKAADDLDNIYKYIWEELFASSAANNILEGIEKEIMRLKEFLFSCNYLSDEYLRNILEIYANTKGIISVYDIFIDLSRHVEAIVRIKKG